MALVLAEHLRAHFSGDKRKSSVKIIEEKDRYRLIFEPCGTGGALRIRNLKGLKKFPNPSADTWGIANEVPPYCSHCARNELTSIKKFGHPLWVTEFDPNPNKPCGWTVYKDPKLIPDSYFKRLGIKRDSNNDKASD